MGRRNILEVDSDGADSPLAAGSAGTVPGWNALALRISGPAQATRVLAIVHTCMYNAWAAYDGDARQTVHGVAVRLPRAERDAASKAAAMSHAARRVLAGLFPDRRRDVDAHMRSLGLDPAAAADPFSPAGIGRTQALAMLDGRHREQPFALVPEAEARGIAPYRPDGAELPAEHWYRLARHVSARDGHDDDRDVRLYFVLANALADAALADAACPAAAAEVLRCFTGSDRMDASLQWATFSAAADASGMINARGGEAGQALGRTVGARVFDKARRYWQGKL